jgi:hypothetical protein
VRHLQDPLVEAWPATSAALYRMAPLPPQPLPGSAARGVAKAPPAHQSQQRLRGAEVTRLPLELGVRPASQQQQLLRQRTLQRQTWQTQTRWHGEAQAQRQQHSQPPPLTPS